ncbi:restriction endonuclease subunit S [Virgibacillus sp. MG-45]|uniref:restriction endonuclease subunit S n=1 Tax=Virgibacillus sp. MG-45 TaxID=3102791 RepID=UPI002ED89CFC
MSEWREVRFNDVIDLNPRVKLEKGIDYPFIGIADINEGNFYVEEGQQIKFTGQSGSKFHSGDTLFSRITPCLENRKIAQSVLKSKDKGFGSTELLVFRAKKGKTDPNFVNYLAQTDIIVLPAINSMSGASGRQRADSNYIKKLKINIPNLSTQKKIVSVLSAYDKLIENNKRRIEILEKVAEEIYKEWFVRMRFPGYENAKFDRGIPEGWKVSKLGSLVNISSSKRVYSSDYVETGIPFYRSKEVIQLSNGEIISDMLYISNEKYREFKEKFGVPQKNDILLTSVGTIGVPMLVRNNNPFYFKDGNLTWIQSRSNASLANYLYYWIKSGVGQQQILASTIGTSQSALTIENLKRVKVIIPDDTVLSMLNNLFSDIIENISNLTTQSQNLIRQRDLLLPKLMNGTIKVK